MEDLNNRDLEFEDENENGITPADPVEAAQAAGLYYVMEGEPGYNRKRKGRGFIYLDPKGKQVTSPRLIQRFKDLVIPPAWSEVWICRRPNGHIQVTGRDTRGRKQYRYHTDWGETRSQTKFSRMAQFGKHLPAIRARVAQDLRRTRLSNEKVTALVVRLLEQTLIRVGNQEYARMNQSYGLTTLLDDHITITGSRVSIEFTGKRGKPMEIQMRDRRLAQLVKRCQDLPGQRLFQYLDENGQCCQTITSGDVNNYLREATGQDFSAKDFRTWGGTVLAAMELYQRGPAENEKKADKQIVQVIKDVAAALNNTPTICRKYYIHPAILDAYRDGSLFTTMAQCLQEGAAVEVENPDENKLTVEEQAVLKLLALPPAE
jgi:DNA topoisomerase I